MTAPLVRGMRVDLDTNAIVILRVQDGSLTKRSGFL
jgi:hypothetical protein